VLSQAAKRRGDERVMAWLEQEESSGHTSTVVIAQLAHLGTHEGRKATRGAAEVARAATRCMGGARCHRLTIVTGNDRDFRRPGVKVFNPFKELP
jgi:hypothetical protein